MRFCAFLCASADFGVRFSYRAISFCSVSCICCSIQVGLLMWSPVAGLFPAVSMGTASHRPNVGAALRHLSQRGLQRVSCGELRLLVYALFRNFLQPSGRSPLAKCFFSRKSLLFQTSNFLLTRLRSRTSVRTG